MEIIQQQVPLRIDDDQVIRVGNTRVTLDSVVYAFQQGATPEEIAQQYSSLQLADIYAALSYYLHNLEDVQRYLAGREEQRRQTRTENRARFGMEGIRERLLARTAH